MPLFSCSPTMVTVFQWPWIHGLCQGCFRCRRSAEYKQIMKCWICWKGCCEDAVCDACHICGKPCCPECRPSHFCVPNQLLNWYPDLQCRFCPRAQDIGNSHSCEECRRRQCINSECQSHLRTTDCPHHKDCCGGCASWRPVWRFRIWSPHMGHTPTPLRQHARWSQQDLYICHRCQNEWEVLTDGTLIQPTHLRMSVAPMLVEDDVM